MADLVEELALPGLVTLQVLKRWRRRLKKYLSHNLPVPGSEEVKRAWLREQHQVLEWKM